MDAIVKVNCNGYKVILEANNDCYYTLGFIRNNAAEGYVSSPDFDYIWKGFIDTINNGLNAEIWNIYENTKG